MTAAGKHPVPNGKPSIRWGRGQEREVGLGIEFRRGTTRFSVKLSAYGSSAHEFLFVSSNYNGVLLDLNQ